VVRDKAKVVGSIPTTGSFFYLVLSEVEESYPACPEYIEGRKVEGFIFLIVIF
jgi:hypothetical protein